MSMTHRSIQTISCVALCLVSLVLGALARAADAPRFKAGVFEPPHPAPDFSLASTRGGPVTLSEFRGKVVVLGFGFTSCPEVCPTTLAVLAAARKKLGADAADVQVVYVTVDPERDTPEHLKKYLSTFDPAIVGASGTPAQLAAVRARYGIQAEKKVFGDSYAYAHSSSILLIDRRGALRALMPYGHPTDDYVHDLRILLGEK